jgi:hypothetical protein
VAPSRRFVEVDAFLINVDAFFINDEARSLIPERRSLSGRASTWIVSRIPFIDERATLHPSVKFAQS